MEQQKSEREILVALEQLRQAKKYKEFFALAEEGAASYPDSFPIRILFAEVLVETKNLSEAEDIFKDLIVSYPDNINLLLDLGKVTFTLEKYDEAAEYLNKILFLDPFNYQAKELLVKIDKIKAGQPAVEPAPAQPESPAYPPQVAGPDELVMPGAQEDEPSPKRSDIDTTPFTAPTKPEDEFEIGQQPDFDTKKVEFDMPTSVGAPGQPPPAPAAPAPGKQALDMEFDIPGISEPEQPAAPPPVPPSTPAAPPPEGDTITEMEFDIPLPGEPEQPPPPPVPPSTPAAPAPGKPGLDMEFEIPGMDESPQIPPPSPGPPPIPAGQEAGKEEKEPEPAKKEFEMEFEIPGMDNSLQPPSPPAPPPVPTGQEAQTGETDFPPPGPPPAAPMDQAEKKIENVPPTRLPDFDTKKVEFIRQTEAGKEKEFEIPPAPVPETASEPAAPESEIELEIPAAGKTGLEAEPPEDETVADTIVEMEAPKIPRVAQGPPIPPPPAAAPPGLEYGISASDETPAGDDEFEIPSAREESQEDIKVEYESPAQVPITAYDEFEMPPDGEESREEIRVEYESPAREVSLEANDAYEIPPVRESEPEEMSPESEDFQAAPVTSEPQEKETDGQIQQEEAEFMTESAAELYLSQGLLDDALIIYEKLYRVQKIGRASCRERV